MPYEVFTVPFETGQPSFMAGIEEGDIKGFFSYPEDDIHAIVITCEDDSAVKVYGRNLGKREGNANPEFNRDDILNEEYRIGEATMEEAYFQEHFDNEGVRGVFMIRHVGRTAAQTEFQIYGVSAPVVVLNPN